MVQIGQTVCSQTCLVLSVALCRDLPAGHNTSTATPAADNDVKLLREGAQRRVRDEFAHFC